METQIDRTEPYSRTARLLGAEALEQLASSRVAVFGLGGVGSFAVEALARSGVGSLDLIDSDTFELSNLNRQLYATYDTIGQYKTDAAAERVSRIAPQCRVRTYNTFFTPETSDLFPFSEFDYILDAIDTVTGKIELVLAAQRSGVPILCSMGAGNKLDPTRFRVLDLYQTSVDPLARVMRRELRRRGVERLKVVCSDEVPRSPEGPGNPSVPGSCAFVPSVCGLILAGEAVKDLTGQNGEN